jgi:hypothetical protein
MDGVEVLLPGSKISWLVNSGFETAHAFACFWTRKRRTRKRRTRKRRTRKKRTRKRRTRKGVRATIVKEIRAVKVNSLKKNEIQILGAYNYDKLAGPENAEFLAHRYLGFRMIRLCTALA